MHFGYFKPFMTILAHANRGNVAVICWNTLRTPTWYVNDEKLDGEISLSASGQKTLLEINFEEYTHENSKEVGKLKEVKTTVTNTPARDTSIGDRQIVLDLDTTNAKYDFDFKAKKDFKKAVQEEKTYTMDAGKTVVAYVPEEVYSDIDSLRNKTVTVVFGEDNIVTLVSVEDDTVEKEFLTKYVVADSEITVGGEKYDLADEYEVKVNDVVVEETDATYELTSDTTFAAGKDYYTYDATNKVYKKADVTVGDSVTTKTYYVIATPAISYDDALEYALTEILGSFTKKAFDKKIEAELTLEDDEVTRIDLFVSMNSKEFETVEAVVTKVKSEEIKTVDENSIGSITWNEKKYDDKDYPRVYIDGKKSEITDIEAGDVLTILGVSDLSSIDAKDIRVIYAARNTVEGQVSRVKNKTEIAIDGETYLPSNSNGAFNLDGEIKNMKDTDFRKTGFNDIHGEDAILYLNVLGEYVLVNADTVDSDWQFAIVDHVYDVEEDAEDSDIYTQKLRLVTMDGTKVRNYKLVYDANTKYKTEAKVISDPDDAIKGKALTENVEKDFVIAFKGNADGEIELEDVIKVDTTKDNTVDNDYEVIFVAENFGEANTSTEKVNYDTKRIDKDGTRYKVTSNTKLVDMVAKETIAWKDLIIDGSSPKFSVASLIIVETDKTEVKYIISTEEANGKTDVEYALVLDAVYTSSKTKTEAKLLGVDGETYVYEYDEKNTDLTDGSLIAYTVNNDKLELATAPDELNIDLETIIRADRKEKIYNNLAKGAYLVDEFNDDYLTYTDDDSDFTVLNPTIVDINTDDVIVVTASLDDNDDVILTQSNYDAETLEGAYVLFFNHDTTDDNYSLLVIIK